MKWWVWALIGIGVLALSYVKLKVFSKIQQKRKKSTAFKDED